MKNILFLVFATLILFSSCKKEEDEIEPPRDMQEQSLIDNQNIKDYLSSHYYNYDDFLDLNYNSELIFDTISGENATKIALIDQVKKEIKTVLANIIILEKNSYILLIFSSNHKNTLYTLKIKTSE